VAADKPNHQVSLVRQVLQNLTDQIKNGDYPPGSRLPPENQLASEYDVSRATIRRAFNYLAERDLIIRRQGNGTYVTYLTSIANPLNQFLDFRERIAHNGFEPGFDTLEVQTVKANVGTANLLRVRPNSQLLRVRKIFSADSIPVIYVVNHIPIWVYRNQLTREEIAQPGFTEPFFDFFEHKCKQPVKYYISSVRAGNARDADLPDKVSSVDPSTPILILDDVGYSYDERPVFRSTEHILNDMIDFHVVRRVDIYK
jgi:GntR family transcriptional regulator|tara:strand:- start:832 stop:1599 length:768 start_codon:yes stop_codon:yes gene_type:complete